MTALTIYPDDLQGTPTQVKGFEAIAAELAAMGRTIDDVRALVLTHGHDDHIGFAERLRVEHDVPASTVTALHAIHDDPQVVHNDDIHGFA